MKWALIDENGIVKNLIAYDGAALYTPTAGLTLQQVNPWVQVGQNADTSEPLPPVPYDMGSSTTSTI